MALQGCNQSAASVAGIGSGNGVAVSRSTVPILARTR